MSEFGERLKKLRTANKMSQYDLSRVTGIEQATISRMERGLTDVLSPHALKLASALGVDVPALLDFDANVVPAMVGVRRMPILDYVQAGRFAGVAPYFRGEEEGEFISADASHSAGSFAMRVRGDSMEPEFYEGELVVIDPAINPRPGDFCIAVDEAGLCTFKRYRSAGLNEAGKEVFELVPLNSNYAVMRSDRQVLRIKGTMVEHRKYRKR